MTTFRVLPERVALARETIRLGGIGRDMELVESDAWEKLQAHPEVTFGFLDAGKEFHSECCEAVVLHLVSGVEKGRAGGTRGFVGRADREGISSPSEDMILPRRLRGCHESDGNHSAV